MGFHETFWIAAHAIGLLGSVSFGYLVLRFSLPDVRVINKQAKLGVSGLIGFVLFGLSYSTNYAINNQYSFLFFLPLFALILTAVFVAKNKIAGAPTITIAVPVVRTPTRAEIVTGEERPLRGRQRKESKVLEEKRVSIVETSLGPGGIAAPSGPRDLGEINPEREKAYLEKMRAKRARIDEEKALEPELPSEFKAIQEQENG